ncbi:ATP-grasp domain-containing protein, partial [Salmonella enterica subsp. enterica serovar Anatum]|nr:ATP-grasp domain-containing protein [Salmonella enterica subsp. enterica serovar Anatum]
ASLFNDRAISYRVHQGYDHRGVALSAGVQRMVRSDLASSGVIGGHGLFGVELFVCGDEVIFSEVSPRPHDTGMVTLISQDLSEFALHVR